MSDHIQLVGFSGSLRKGSYNTMLLKAALQLLPTDVSMEIISIEDIPLYNADLDLPAAKQRPQSVEHFRKMLTDADGILIASPEYNYSIPGGLKNAIDWASRGEDSPLLRKPVAVIGATSGLWGTARMQLAFQNVFLYLDMKPVFKPEVLVAQAERKFDKEGNLIDEMAKKLLKQKLAALKEMINLQLQVGDVVDSKII
ncbi:MAG: NAD(P)H-dependent oxidoreductase [Bacteroidetes bacterium]|jgi:chromate reductase|nr:MAG: NAD(P)H-dependent oxidoreductase [Bacteroidota bacterium]